MEVETLFGRGTVMRKEQGINLHSADIAAITPDKELLSRSAEAAKHASTPGISPQRSDCRIYTVAA